MIKGKPIAAIRVAVLFACQTLLVLASANCVPYPVATRIGNVTLPNGQVARGAAFSIGTPEQEFSFLPQWPLNNILVYGTNGYCIPPAPGSRTGCTTWRGGQYDTVASTTRRIAEAGSYPSETNGYPSMDFFSDVLKINSNVSLKTVPMGMPLADWGQEGYHPIMAIGLGKNSTLLGALKSTGKIVSRTWSMFYGWTGTNTQTQVDGTFVFGGYDRAKVSGTGYSIAMTEHNGCESQLMVTIDDMILNFPNGSTASLFQNSKDAIVACIVPDYPVLMTIPLDPYFQAFQNLTNTSINHRTFGFAYYSMIYENGDKPYTGDLTIKLQSGPTIRIPNHQLVVPDRYIDPSNGEMKANGSVQNLILNTVQNINAKDLPKLGRQFLSSAYIMVNQDKREFKIWRSNPTSVVDLIAIDEKGNEISNYCGSGPGPGNSSSTPDSPESSTDGKRLPIGIIVGSSVGGIAVVTITCIAVFLFFRYRRRAASVPIAADSSSQPLSNDRWKHDQHIQDLPAQHVSQEWAELPYEHSPRERYELQGLSQIRSPGNRMRPQSRFELPS